MALAHGNTVSGLGHGPIRCLPLLRSPLNLPHERSALYLAVDIEGAMVHLKLVPRSSRTEKQDRTKNAAVPASETVGSEIGKLSQHLICKLLVLRTGSS